MFSFHRSALALVTSVSLASGVLSAATYQPASLPLTFERNNGQAKPDIKYLFRHGFEASFTQRGVGFILPTQGGVETKLRLEFLSSNPHTRLSGVHRLRGESNYFLGSNPSQFVRHIPNYSDIRYNAIYAGIALDFYGSGSDLEHDFTIAPHADPSAIAFRFLGADDVAIMSDGDLRIRVGRATIVLRKPAAYQTIAGQRRIVAAGFVHRKNGATAFRVGGYDQTRLLTIDPIFDFSTYLDGSLSDQAAAVTTDSTGNIYLTGTTASTDFPTQNPEQTALGCSPNGPSYCQNAFVTKLDPTGKTLIYSTYVGGSAQDFGATIAVDGNGHAIIGGVSDSANFPKAGSVPAPSCQTNWFCYFVASLSADGSSLNYSGLIGGEQGEYTNGNNGRLTVDSTGNAYLAGVTGTSSFDITPGTLSTTVPGYPYTTMFVLKVDPTGKLIYSTIVPGNAPQNPADVYNNWFLPSAIAVNSSGQAIVAGTAGLGLPTTAGVVSSTFPNDSAVENASAGFILQLNATASAINYATYLPGTDLLGGMAVDLSGNIYVAGTTSEINLPVGPNAYQSTPVKEADGGIWTGYIAKLNATATSVLAATYLDGTNASLNNGTGFDGLALDSNTNVFVGGFTGSSDFPLQDPFTSQFETGSSEWEMVLAEMTPDLSALEFGSFLSSTDSIYAGSNFAGLAVDSSNNLIIAGTTNASNFPTTAGSFQTQPPPSSTPNASYIHSFVSKIDMSTAAPSVCPSAWSISLGSLAALSTSQTTLNVTNCGNAALNFNNLNSSVSTITASQSCGSVAPGAVCPITITFAPIDSTTSLGTLSLADNAALSPQVIQVSGQGKAPSLVPQSNPFAFGHLLAGASGVTNSLLISNNGNAPLNIQSATIGGPGFSIAQNQCTQSVPAGSICLIGITFGPTAPGNYQGTLTLDSNDPVHPSLAVTLTGTGDSTYGVPTISQVIGDTNTPQQSLQINNGPVTLNLVGANFYPQSVVQLNGVAQQSTFFSNTAMQAVIAASSLSALGEFPLTVVNPTPGGGSSTPVTMTTFEQLPVNPNALVSVPATGLLYAAMPSTDATNPNTVLPINPATGNLGTPIPVGQNPTLLAPSSDGNYLYVANATDLTVQRISLQSNSVDETFPFPLDPDCTGCTLPPAVDLKSVPGSPQEVILSQGAEISLYNSSGLVNYIPTTPIYSALGPAFGSMAFAGNPVTLYAEPFTDVQNPFFNTAQITNSGLSWTEPTGYTGPPAASYGSQVVSDGNLLYTDSGEIWNPVTQSMIGTFPVNISYGEYGDLAVDTTLGQIFATGLGTFPGPPDTYIALAISSYGLASHAAQQTVAFPINASENYDLARWGSNGFAFVVSNLFSGSSGVYLVRSSALAGDVSNPVPGLSSITPNSATAGSAAITLNVNGSSFVSGAVVSWNGTTLPTAYVSAAQLTAAVPASDIASAGTALVTVTNPVPGGGISAAETFTINPAAPGITLSPTSLSFGSINVGVSSAAQPIMLQNSGSGALSLSGIGVSGDFSETNTCGASIAVGTGCTISVIFTPTAAGSRTGALTISSNATGSPQSAALSGTGVMTTPVVTLAPEQLTFGSQAQGVASGAQSITLANSGTAPLAVSVIAVSGDFAQTNTCPSPLGVGDTCSIAVTFTPTATGARTGSLSVTDNATGSPQTVALAGTGVATMSIGPPSGGSTTATVTSGGTATYNLILAGGPGFGGSVSLACASLPQNASCTLSPNSLTFSPGGSANFTVSINTASSATALINQPGSATMAGFGITGVLSLPLLLFVRRRRMRLGLGLHSLFLLLALVVLAGCGGGGSSHSSGSQTTLPGTYTVTINATSGGQSASESLTLIVQ